MTTTRILLVVTIASMAIFLSSCGESTVNIPPVVKEVLTTLSCKNESAEELWNARIVLDERSFGFGFIGIGKKAAMVAGNIAMLKKLTVYYSFAPPDGDEKKIVNKIIEYRGDKLAALAGTAGEVEVVCHGDGKWAVRVYEKRADNNGPIILEEAMGEK